MASGAALARRFFTFEPVLHLHHFFASALLEFVRRRTPKSQLTRLTGGLTPRRSPARLLIYAAGTP
jgi:hypothetical protein